MAFCGLCTLLLTLVEPLSGSGIAYFIHAMSNTDPSYYRLRVQTLLTRAYLVITGLLADLWTLRGGAPGDAEDATVAWVPLELPGAAPAARKGAAVAGASGLWLVVMGGRTAEVG